MDTRVESYCHLQTEEVNFVTSYLLFCRRTPFENGVNLKKKELTFRTDPYSHQKRFDRNASCMLSITIKTKKNI